MAKLSQIKLGSTTYDIGAAWGNISGKPSTFPPESHTHNYAGSPSTGGPANSANLLNLNHGSLSSTASTARSSWTGGVSGTTSWKYVWGQSFFDSSIGTDSGDLVFGLRAGEYTSGGTELCLMLDGDYYSMGNKVLHAGNYNSYAATKNHNHDSTYLKLSGGTLTGTVNSSGNMNLYGSNAYFSLGTSSNSSKCYFQTYNATTAGADDANLKAGFGFGWSSSLVIDKSGNVTIPGDLTVSGGDITGNASSATKATNDGDNNVITTTYVKKSGDTMSGALNFANGTWNKVGDDCALGDYNQAGVIGIKGLNGATGIYFVPYSGSVAQKISIDGAGTMFISGKTSTDAIQVIQNGVTSHIQSLNASWLHYTTNSPEGHWFNTDVSVQGNIYAGSGYNKLVLTEENYSNYAATKNHNHDTKYVTLDTTQTISGTKTMTGSLKVSGRYAGGGDDEGIIVGFANNGYAGLCLGGPSEARSVFYFKSDGTKPFWRYNNGSASYDITHPGKSGTIALTSDLGSYADKNHTHASLTTNGGGPNTAIYFSQGQPTACNTLLHHDVSGYSAYVMYSDTRNDNQSPDDVQRGLTIHLKANGSDGISDGGSYHAVLSAKDWGDYSGGPYWQSTVTANNNMYFRRSTAGTTWGSWQKVLSDNNYSSYALPLTGGTLTGGLAFSGSNGIITRHIDGENSTFAGDLYLNYGRSAPIHVGSGGAYTISADGSYYNGASAATYNLYNTRSVSGDSHAAALKNEFNSYKSSIGRNRLSTYYSSAYSNGSFYMGYFLSGYDTSPYGGFYVCHYNTPYYVGISNGTFTQYQLWKAGDAVTGAVWNDYAECRESDIQEAGYVMIENGDDTLSKSTERLQQFAGISSDTWGFSQGETERARTHIAVAGRVLAHPYRNRNEYKPGDAVCAAPGGTVDIMTEEEIVKYPHRIVGTVSCVPDYEEWGGGNDREPVKVNGRIWIKVR